MTTPRTISFFVAGIPKGQPRPRAFARKFGDKWRARVYDAGTAEEWKSQIALAAKCALKNDGREFCGFDGPVLLRTDFFLPRPKSHFRSNGELKASAPTYHTSKPDFDNYAKAVADALTQLGFWRDDSQISAHGFTKTYATAMNPPGAKITIRELSAQIEEEVLKV